MNLLQAVIFSTSNLTNHFPILQLNFRIKTTYFTFKFYDTSFENILRKLHISYSLNKVSNKILSLKIENPGINSFGVAYIFCV